ncbi:MAG: hypothetical protein FJ100_11360 [Deltaproteobacteria bacterium]|nr:hypothetical protein [Deltaproteobacteria bacterium]
MPAPHNRPHRPEFVALLLGWAASASACTDTVAVCHSGAQCASGVCLASGSCAPEASDAAAGDVGAVFGGDGLGRSADSAAKADTRAAGPDAAAEAAGTGDIEPAKDAPASPGDAKPEATGGQDASAGDTQPPLDADPPAGPCKPNHDGQIVHGEVPIAPGLTVPYRVAENVAVNLVPKTVEGKPTWDLASLPGDAKVDVVTLDPAKQWFGKHYPDATYAVQLTKASPLLGVFRLGAASLDLLAVASPQDGLFSTRVTYDPPVAMLKFPLTATSAWATKTTVSGLLDGVVSAWSETVELTAMGQGHLLAPMGAFPIIAVRGRVDKKVGLFTTTYRSYAFVAECYGVVGKVDSKANEGQPEFTQAAEARRVGP